MHLKNKYIWYKNKFQNFPYRLVFQRVYSEKDIIYKKLMFVYYCTDMNCDWYIIMTIKKGVYSVIIAETTHNFFESIFYTRFVNISKNTQLVSLYQTGGIFFCILIFAIVCGFAIFKKDIILVALNFLMYCGITFKFFISGLNEDIGDGIGIICCIILVAQIGIMAFMIIKFKEQLLES